MSSDHELLSALLRMLAIGLMAASITGAERAAAEELKLYGVLVGRGIGIEGQRSWTQGGFGRLTEGAAGPRDRDLTGRSDAHLGLDWRPTETWLVHAHAVLHGQPSVGEHSRVGVAEAFIQYRPELTPRLALRARAGTFFPQTSLENTEPLWQSPYSLTLSAVNTWAAEELRVTGVEAAVFLQTGKEDRLELGGTLLSTNDPAGALLAWRGWTLGDRLTGFGEVLPLPPLSSLAPGGGFALQDAGTRPIDELDSRAGWQARVRWERPRLVELRAAYLDNRGDRRLYRGQYAWRTSLTTAGLALHFGPQWTVLAEAVAGRTGMGVGPPDRAHVDMDFRAGYLLASRQLGRWRVSGRVDGFRNLDRDGTAEPNQEHGWAGTAAVLWSLADHWRLAAEYVLVRADRPAAAPVASIDTAGQRAVVELRIQF